MWSSVFVGMQKCGHLRLQGSKYVVICVCREAKVWSSALAGSKILFIRACIGGKREGISIGVKSKLEISKDVFTFSLK